ncbi:hypothetical protein BpHYR1_021885 [Brachionus plicatilis]|uniref:Uncharacterized protein n=1 Tax=Brachionus plicatilis TaxID=10195 RepID=A0A3M7SMJ3_BRAPC|nr:hypothetical protein BpHYR1_021885 [Brachionus plicatilis]
MKNIPGSHLFLCIIFNNDFKNKIELMLLRDFDFNGNYTHDLNRFKNVFNLTIHSSKMTRLTLNISKTKIKDFIIKHTDLTGLENPDQLNTLDISHNLMQKFDRIIFDKNSSSALKIVSNGNRFTVLPEFFASSNLVFVKELETCFGLNGRFELESLVAQSLNEHFEMKINNHSSKKFYKITVNEYKFGFLSFAENYERITQVLCLLKDTLFYFHDQFEICKYSLLYQKNKTQVSIYSLKSDNKTILKTQLENQRYLCHFLRKFHQNIFHQFGMLDNKFKMRINKLLCDQEINVEVIC